MGVKVGDAKCKSNNFQSLWCCGFHSNPGWQMNPTFKSQDSPNVYCNSSIAKNLKILPVSGHWRKKCENYSYLVTSSTFVFPSFKWVLMNIFHSGMLRVAIKKVTRWRLDIFFLSSAAHWLQSRQKVVGFIRECNGITFQAHKTV